MTLRAYRTFRLGGFHVTVSRSGVSTSIGGKQTRVGARARAKGYRASVKVPGTSWRLRKG